MRTLVATSVAVLASALVGPSAFAQDDPTVPGPPVAFNANWNVDDTLRFSWLPPHSDGGSPVSEYRIYSRLVPESGNLVAEHWITAVNAEGEGEPSAPALAAGGGSCVYVIIAVPPGVHIDPECLPVPLPPLVCLYDPPICI